MIEFEQALKTILHNTKTLPAEKVKIDDSVGMVLMEDVYSNIDMPPFDKSAMDGYAVKAEDLKSIPTRLRCIGSIAAGDEFKKKISRGECVKIMTGAMLPKDTDSVVMVEHTKLSGQYVKIEKPVKKWGNVCFQGEDIKKRQKVLERRKTISVSDVALLATVGRRFIKVIKRPKVAILNTGGEIVPVGNRLKGKKIYNSNGPQLLTLVKEDRISPCFLGIAKDKTQTLNRTIKKGLEKDVLLISGGVSMGDYDLVPDVLKKLGVKKIFHKVNIKPGKPLFFGRLRNKIIFGIPGNPVSNFLAYLVFIRPALYKMMGNNSPKPVLEQGVLDRGFRRKPGRKHFALAKITKKDSHCAVSPVESHGSADILALSKADGFMVIDGKRDFVESNSKVQFVTWKK